MWNDSQNSRSSLIPKSAKKAVLTVLAVVVVLLGSCAAGNIVENVDANEIVVIQSPISGDLAVYTTSGMKPQWFGKVTRYHKRDQLWFSKKNSEGGDQARDESIKVRFNDGGHAQISGSVAWELPIAAKQMLALHQKYGSQEAIKNQLVRTIVEKSVYMTGPLMSSRESYAEKRNDLISLIEDQISNGVFRTRTTPARVTDPITGEQKMVNVLTIMEQGGQRLRQEASPLKEFNIRTFNLSLNSIDYDDKVEKQIQAQQQAAMDVQTAIAQAKKAEQDAITAAKHGEAQAAKAKWEQEVIKAKAVTEAEQKREVARLDAEQADFYKTAQTRRGEGDAAYKRLVMQADGALAQKLATYLETQKVWASAVANYKGAWVPHISTGGNGNGNTPASNWLMEMFAVKTARDLAVEVKAPAN